MNVSAYFVLLLSKMCVMAVTVWRIVRCNFLNTNTCHRVPVSANSVTYPAVPRDVSLDVTSYEKWTGEYRIWLVNIVKCTLFISWFISSACLWPVFTRFVA